MAAKLNFISVVRPGSTDDPTDEIFRIRFLSPLRKTFSFFFTLIISEEAPAGIDVEISPSDAAGSVTNSLSYVSREGVS
jgi:hypothetical protein